MKLIYIRLYTHGIVNVYSQLAAMLESQIRKVEMVDGINSYADWIKQRHYCTSDIYSLIIPGLLQYLDLPDHKKSKSNQDKNE